MDAERRQVTVLFTDMVGFTTYSEQSGEESAFTLMRSLAKLMEDAVRDQGGVVQGFTGDGVMAVFGAPVAFEDAPLRACRAALTILQMLKTAGADLEAKHGIRPRLRIGINSGSAVVGRVQGGADASVTVLGDTANFAARLQALAEPGSAVMSDATRRQVQGLVEATFVGEHQIKGKSQPQKAYRLDAIRQGATRFGAALGRGLSAYVGRERELDILERCLAVARGRLQIVDVVAEPGMGKSRLIHEFCQRIGKEQAFVMSGSCLSDGQQTPLLPFIEVVGNAFQVGVGEGEREVARKLTMGLTVLGLYSLETLGLLLNMLGLKTPDGALAGLDGVLIGLRTRDLLQQLIEARSRPSPVVLIIEDAHWIDSVSEEVLGKIIDADAKIGLIIVHTRRPEYQPNWLDRPVVTKLRLEPLPAGDIRRLVQSRLGVDMLPETFSRLVVEKSEGNALFAEEIVSFLTEQAVLRISVGKVEFDANAVAAALPASIESLLTARVDRFAPQDRALLQAAAVIGRRFDPQLLAVVANDGGDIDARLAAMQTLDLVHAEGTSGDYSFKHALVRDALYQSLLTTRRVALHLKIAEEIERRSGNRLAEVVETLAYHYSQTDNAEKAFRFLAMAGAKSLGVYSLNEADGYFAAAISLVDKNANCASDERVAELLSHCTRHSFISTKFTATIELVDRFSSRLERLGYNRDCILVQYHYVLALLMSARYREAEKAQTKLSASAAQLHDARSTAYALTSALNLSLTIAPKSVEIFEALSCEATAAAACVGDVYLESFLAYVVGLDEFHRGRMDKAHEAADKLIANGQRMNDPRSIGLAMSLRAWIAICSDDYLEALSFAETSISVSRTPFDKIVANTAKIVALVLLRRPEAYSMLTKWIDLCTTNRWGYFLAGVDGIFGVALVLRGKFGEGIHWMEQAILRRENEGYPLIADWYRMFLCEIYLEIVSGAEKPSAKVIVRNLPTLVSVMFTAQRRILSLTEHVRQNTQVDPNGHHIGRCEMILGLLYKAKNKRALALQHLTEAKRIDSQFGSTPMSAQIDRALAEL